MHKYFNVHQHKTISLCHISFNDTGIELVTISLRNTHSCTIWMQSWQKSVLQACASYKRFLLPKEASLLSLLTIIVIKFMHDLVTKNIFQQIIRKHRCKLLTIRKLWQDVDREYKNKIMTRNLKNCYFISIAETPPQKFMKYKILCTYITRVQILCTTYKYLRKTTDIKLH